MNLWLAAALVLLAGGVGATVWGVATGPLRRRAVAQNLATSVTCLVLLLLAQGYGRPSYTDVGLVLALLGPVGTLVYARLLADDLRRDPPDGRLPSVLLAVLTAVVAIALAVAAGPGRAAVKPLLAGALLIAGNLIASRALPGGLPDDEPPEEPPEEDHGLPGEGLPDEGAPDEGSDGVNGEPA